MKKLTIGRVLLLIAGAVALSGSVLYLVFDGTDRTFHTFGFILGIVGAASTAIALFTDAEVSPLVPAVLYAAACALVLRVAVPSLSDVWNHVNFIGGNAFLGMTFAGVYLTAAILGVIVCFAGITRK